MPELEQIIKEEGCDKFPRVTIEDIEAAIASEHYFTAMNGVVGAAGLNTVRHVPELDLLTFCVLVLKNGFTVTGEGACASPENFNVKAGRAAARRNAISKMWPLLGYALRQELYEANRDSNQHV